MGKSIFGYELSAEKRNIMTQEIGYIWNFDPAYARVFHNHEIFWNHRHIDALVGKDDDGAAVVASFGCSARRVSKRPFVEAFARVKNVDSKEWVEFAYMLIRNTCFNMETDPVEYECGLLNGYEYLFFDDENGKLHDLGYDGVFVFPSIEREIKKFGKVEFYQIIPAYKKELLFLESSASKVDYKKLCQAIVENLRERQFIDVKYEMLSNEQLEFILKCTIENSKNK